MGGVFRRAATAAAALALLGSAGPGAAEDRDVRVVNGFGRTMTSIYVSNSSRTTWEEDILGSRVLPAGQTLNINVDDGSGACLYDFRAVFDDGDVLTRSQVNVCQINELDFGGDRGVPTCPGDRRCK